MRPATFVARWQSHSTLRALNKSAFFKCRFKSGLTGVSGHVVLAVIMPACLRQAGWSGTGRRGIQEKGPGVTGWQGLSDGASDCRACGHSRSAGMDYLNHWIPRPLVPDAALPPASMQAGLRRNDGRGRSRAFAGNGGRVIRMATGLFFSSSSFRRRPESTPKGMQGVEPRREQAAEVVEPRREQASGINPVFVRRLHNLKQGNGENQ